MSIFYIFADVGKIINVILFIPFPSLFGESEVQFGDSENEFGQSANEFGNNSIEFRRHPNSFAL